MRKRQCEKRIVSMFMAVIMIVLLWTPVQVQAEETSGTCGENLTWTLSEDGVLTISGQGKMDNFDTHWDFEKQEHVLDTPWNNKIESIYKVIIDEGVTRIGDYAFGGCEKLISVEIPNGVTSIEASVFSGCTNLTSIEIPNSVTYMGRYAFSGCTSLKSIKISENITRIEDGALSKCTNLTSIEIPNGVTSIGDGAFLGCTNLTSIEIPNGVTSIEDSVFSGCTNLTSIEIPNGVTSIGFDAFSNCSSLKSIEIPNSVTYMGGSAFENCSSLVNVKLSQNMPYLSEYTFWGCSSLESIEIPNGVTTLLWYCFLSCDNLTSIKIPESVSSMYELALSGNGLKYIEVADGNEAFCDVDGVLYNKSKTNLILYPSKRSDATYSIIEGVTCIGDYAFQDCNNLITVSIPEGVTEIRYGAFQNCKSLQKVDCPKSLKQIKGYVDYGAGTGEDVGSFDGCIALTEITIPKNVSVEEGAFSNVPLVHNLSADEGSSWGAKKVHNYDASNCPICESGIESSSIQTSTYYDIWCAGSSKWQSTSKNFDLHVGDTVYNTGNSYKARPGSVPVELADQVSVSKDGYITCNIPRALVYSCHEIVLYPNTTKNPFIQFAAARETGYHTYTNLSVSHLSAYESSMQTYDFYVDINWNEKTAGKIYLKQGNTVLALKEGLNKGVVLGTFTKSGGDIYLCYETSTGQCRSQKLYLDVYKSSVSNMTIDAGETTSGKNMDSAEVDEMWGEMQFSFDMLSDSFPVELKLKPTSSNRGTFEGTVGIKINNADSKTSVFNKVSQVLSEAQPGYVSKDTIDNTIKSLEKAGNTVSSTADQFLFSVSTKLIGYVKGTYEIGANGQLVDMTFDQGSGLIASVGGSLSTTRQHFVSPFPWYWQLEMKAKLGISVNLDNEYDGTQASIAPIELNGTGVELGAALGAGVSGAVSIGVAGSGEVHFDGQLLPLNASKLEIYADYNLRFLTYEVGPFSGQAWKYSSDKYYLLKNGKWFPDSQSNSKVKMLVQNNELTGEMNQISREYLQSESVFVSDVNTFNARSISENSGESILRSNTYTFTEPQMVKISDNKKIVVWVDDPGEEARPVDINRGAIYYSIYDGNNWGEPQIVEDDGTADSYPVLKYIDGNVHLVWIDENKVFTEEGTYEEYCEAADISYAYFDESANEFTNISTVATNDAADILPDLVVVNGNPVVVWVQNSENDPTQMSGTNTVYAATMNEENWTVEALQEKCQMVDWVSAACEEDMLAVYISQDTDNDVETTADKEIFKLTKDTKEQLTDNEMVDTKPVLIDEELYWYREGNLTNGTATVSFAESTDRIYTASNGYESVILYTKYNEDYSTVVYANYFDGTEWSEAITVIESDQYISKLSCVMDAYGNLEIVTNSITVEEESFEQADLKHYTVENRCDLSITNVEYDSSTMTYDGNLEIIANIKNNGTSTIDYLSVVISQGENILVDQYKETKLLAGAEDCVILECPSKELLSNEELIIEISSAWENDVNEDDNTARCEIRTKDVSVEEVTAKQVDEKTIVSAYISNRGLEMLDEVEISVYKDAPEGTPLATQTVSDIEADLGESISFELNLEEDTLVYVVAEELDSENTYANNQEFTLVSNFDVIYESGNEGLPFTDVKESNWFYEFVEYVYQNGIMAGKSATTFEPNTTLTRSEVAMILYRLNGEPNVDYTSVFSDVPEGKWYTDAVIWASEAGVVLGYDDGTFRPGAEITREQFALMMYRYAEKMEYDISKAADFEKYPDKTSVSNWAETAMKWAVGNDIITGNADGTLAPKGNTSRAQCATIITRFMKLYSN